MVTSDLLDPAIAGSVRVLVESEVAGERMFATAERHARVAADRRLWEALHALEVQTRAAVFHQLGDDAARFGVSERIARAAGNAGGSGLALLPRPWQMRSLVIGTKAFVPTFRKLDDHFAAGPRSAFFSYVLAHELAIAEAGRRALAHDPDPVAPVAALLGNVPR